MGAELKTAKTGDVIKALARIGTRGRSAVCLIGAGCSFTAGVPTAEEVVEHLRKIEPKAYRAAWILTRKQQAME